MTSRSRFEDDETKSVIIPNVNETHENYNYHIPSKQTPLSCTKYEPSKINNSLSSSLTESSTSLLQISKVWSVRIHMEEVVAAKSYYEIACKPETTILMIKHILKDTTGYNIDVQRLYSSNEVELKDHFRIIGEFILYKYVCIH